MASIAARVEIGDAQLSGVGNDLLAA